MLNPNKKFPHLKPLVLSLMTGMAISVAPSAAAEIVLVNQASPLIKEVRSYSVSAGSLSQALNQFAEQTNILLSFNTPLAQDKHSEGLKGDFTAVEALEQLLKDTGINAEIRNNRVILIPGTAIEVATKVTVTAMPLDNPNEYSAFRMDAETIAKTPSMNGDIASLLQSNPKVQFDESFRSSLQGGEITPSKISIHGGKFYDNNFSINGVSNTNIIDPVSDNPHNLYDTPGHQDRFYINNGLLESFTVYDNNVPARYGSFTGGVIDAELKRAPRQFEGSLSVKGTSDSLAEFKVIESQRDSFENSSSYAKQPYFTKLFYHFDVGTAINDSMAVLFSYDHQHSDIPIYQYGALQDQSRNNENILLQLSWDGDNSDKLDLSFMHTPYTGTYFTKDTLNSEFDIIGGGQVLAAKYERPFAMGKYYLNANYSFNENSRTAPGHWFNWRNTASKNWGPGTYSREGGFGDLDKKDKRLSIDQEFKFNEVEWAGLKHQVSTGLQVAHNIANYTRDSALNSNSTAQASSVVDCQGNNYDCIDGEQYFRRRTVYEAEDVEVSVNTMGVFVEDYFKWQNIEVSPGVRADYDDFTKNLNIAPRLAAKYNLGANQQHKLTAGINRYYGNSPLTYKLREARTQGTLQERSLNGDNTLGDWVDSSNIGTLYQYDQLDTPFNDEWNLGYAYEADLFKVGIDFTHRDGKDLFARERVNIGGVNYYIQNNNGTSESETLALTIQSTEPYDFKGASISWSAGLSHNAIFNSHNDFDDTVDEDDVNEWRIYDGELVRKIDKPADNFNRPILGHFSLSADIPAWNLTFSNRTSYTGGYKDYDDVGTRDVVIPGQSGTTTVDVYEVVQFDPAVMFDWIIRYEQPLSSLESVYAELQIDNVFNEGRRQGGSSTETYDMGRQFWLEFGMKF